MSDCSNHKREVAGITDMKVLAGMIGDLHYETLSVFLDELTNKLYLDGAKDRAAKRFDLARFLEMAASDIYSAHIEIESAWQISKPFMNSPLNR